MPAFDGVGGLERTKRGERRRKERRRKERRRRREKMREKTVRREQRAPRVIVIEGTQHVRSVSNGVKSFLKPFLLHCRRSARF